MYGELAVREARLLRSLEDENAQLNWMLAAALLANAPLRDLLRESW